MAPGCCAREFTNEAEPGLIILATSNCCAVCANLPTTGMAPCNVETIPPPKAAAPAAALLPTLVAIAPIRALVSPVPIAELTEPVVGTVAAAAGLTGTLGFSLAIELISPVVELGAAGSWASAFNVVGTLIPCPALAHGA